MVTSASTTTSRAKSFIRKKLTALHRGDVNALVASSIAIASSIGSPSLHTNHLSSSGGQKAHTSHPDRQTIGQKPGSHPAVESAWKTAYSTARMVVDVTKESSDMFLPLKTVVGALSFLIKNYDQTASNARQVEELEQRVLSLSDILRSPLKEGDRSERTRRELLCRRLMDVIVKLEPLSEQNALLRFLQNQDHASSLSGFVQEVAEAITDYQISLQQNTYENTRDIQEVVRIIDQTTRENADKTGEITEAAELQVLDRLNPVLNAGHRAAHHETCLSGTRESILGNIMSWAKSVQDQPVFWLNGLAGTGKSTIAQTFSEWASSEDILGASFFCSRDYSERKMLKNIFPTLAYQLACRYPRFRNHLVQAIKRDSSVAHSSLISQLSNLLLDPLSATGIPCVIVIDALDECADDEPASAILSVLGRLVSKLPLVKFFITGRPELQIRYGFRLPLLEPFTQIFLLHEVDPTSVEGDIRLYLKEKLTTMAKRRSALGLPEAWPSDEDISGLARKCSGLFVFASTVVRFIDSKHLEPRERLRLVVGKGDDTSCEGATGVDSLYHQVLCDAFSGVNEDSLFINLKRILGAVMVALNPLSRDGLAKLLNVDSALISTTLQHLHSVVLVPANGSEEIRIFHKSFPDFLQDPKRCPDPRFNIDPKTCHGDMVLSCLDLIGKLGINPCSLPPFVMNQDIQDPLRLLDVELGSGPRYACKFWSSHLLLSPTSGEHRDCLIASTSQFFKSSVFPWMEIMSLEGRLEDVIHSVNIVLDWLSKTGTANYTLPDLAADCLRFTRRFFQPIQMSSQHLYHTALPLSPMASPLRFWFLKYHPSWAETQTTWQASTDGSPAKWGGSLQTIKTGSRKFTYMAMVGQRIVAVDDGNIVNVYDPVTGVVRLTIKSLQPVEKVTGPPDGSVLFCSHRCPAVITMWDTQTGGSIHSFAVDFEIGDIGVSLKAKFLASCSLDGTFKYWKVESRCEGSRNLGIPITSICCLGREEQVALALDEGMTLKGGTILVVEMSTGRTLHTFSAFYGSESVKGIAFSPRKHRLAIQSTFDRVVVVHPEQGTRFDCTPPLLLGHMGPFAFSDGGDRIFCATEEGDLVRFDVGVYAETWVHLLSGLGTIDSIDCLGCGQLAANHGDHIQVLATEHSRTLDSSEQKLSYVCPLDDGKAIGALSQDFMDIHVLGVETNGTLSRHSIELSCDPPFPPHLLCASINRGVVIFSLQNGPEPTVQVVSLNDHHLIWEAPLERKTVLGALSPDGEKLILVMEGEDLSGDGVWEVCVREMSNGKILSSIIQTGGPPNGVVFVSETQFYTEHLLSPSTPPPETECLFEAKSDFEENFGDVRTTFVLTHGPDGYDVRKVLEGEILRRRPYYALDENLEWVVDAKSRRVCWLPPGYVTGKENEHFFVGSSIVMAGQDGVVRRLTFKEPRSD